MKKSLIKAAFALSTFTLLFSSCLGDNETTFEASDDFAYIKSEGYGVQYAVVSQYWVNCSSAEISELNPGDCYFLSYKINQANLSSTGVYAAENVSVSKPIDRNGGGFVSGSNSIPAGNEIYPSFTYSKFYPTELINDNWMFTTTAKLADGDKVYAYFFIDENNQTDDQSGLKHVTVDVRFAKGSDSEGASTQYRFIQNMSELRNYIKGNSDKYLSYSSEGLAYVYLQFRTMRDAETANPLIPATITNYSGAFMLFTNQ